MHEGCYRSIHIVKVVIKTTNSLLAISSTTCCNPRRSWVVASVDTVEASTLPLTDPSALAMNLQDHGQCDAWS